MRITNPLIKMIDEQGAGSVLAEVLLRKAMDGDFKFFEMLLDRIEGPVKRDEDKPVADENIATLRELFAQKSKRRRRKES